MQLDFGSILNFTLLAANLFTKMYLKDEQTGAYPYFEKNREKFQNNRTSFKP